MSIKQGVYTFKFLPRNVHPPLYGGMYATAVDLDAPIIAAPRTPEFFSRQSWSITQVKETDFYLITLESPFPETLYMGTQASGSIERAAIILTRTPKYWSIFPPNAQPSEGSIISALTPVIGFEFCIGLSDTDQLIIKTFPHGPAQLRPHWDIESLRPFVPLGPGPVVSTPALGQWVSQKLIELYEAVDGGMFEAILESFIARDAKITYNGVVISRDEYKKKLLTQAPLEVSAKARIVDTVEVPADPAHPIDAGTVGVFYHAYIVSDLSLMGAPEQHLATSSLDVVVKSTPHTNNADTRRVVKLTQVLNSQLLFHLPIVTQPPPQHK